jgi:hypothetical protein
VSRDNSDYLFFKDHGSCLFLNHEVAKALWHGVTNNFRAREGSINVWSLAPLNFIPQDIV